MYSARAKSKIEGKGDSSPATIFQNKFCFRSQLISITFSLSLCSKLFLFVRLGDPIPLWRHNALFLLHAIPVKNRAVWEDKLIDIYIPEKEANVRIKRAWVETPGRWIQFFVSGRLFTSYLPRMFFQSWMSLSNSAFKKTPGDTFLRLKGQCNPKNEVCLMGNNEASNFYNCTYRIFGNRGARGNRGTPQG